MKVGLLGSGFMGGTHARAFAKLPDVDVVSVSSRSEEKAKALADEVGAVATTDPMSVIHHDDVEAVSITLPTHLHKEYTLAALEAGKHVLLEKPFALTVEDCDAMIAAQQQSGAILMVAHVLRFWPAYIEMIKYVQLGKLGKPLSAVASRLSTVPGWADWFTDPAKSGGAVIDLMIHDFDTLNWTFGTPQTVYARGHEAAPGLWNQVHAVLDYGESNGSIETSEFMPQDYPFTATYKVICEQGTVEFVLRAGGVSVEMEGVNTLIVYENGNAFELDAEASDPYENQIAYFADCVRDQKFPEDGTPAQAKLALQTALAAKQSLETGQIVSL